MPELDRRILWASAACIVGALSVALVALLSWNAGAADSGLWLTVRDAGGTQISRNEWPATDLSALRERLPESTAPIRAHLEGLWRVPTSENGELWVKADGWEAAVLVPV